MDIMGRGETLSPVMCERTPSIEERLVQKKIHLEGELKRTTDALDALRKNPEVMNVINLISKAGY